MDQPLSSRALLFNPPPAPETPAPREEAPRAEATEGVEELDKYDISTIACTD